MDKGGSKNYSAIRQSWPNLEVILSDCSDAGVAARPELDGLRSDFDLRGWQIIRAAESSRGTTRTTAVARAHGDHLLFMESADYANPDAVATFVEVAGRISADVLTCFLALGGIRDGGTLIGHCPFLGAAVVTGVFHNHFGSRCIFIRKDAFSRIGPFREDSRANCEDWAFLARAALIGLRLEVVPRPLVSCRLPDNSGVRLEDEYHHHLPALKPYAEAMPLPKANKKLGGKAKQPRRPSQPGTLSFSPIYSAHSRSQGGDHTQDALRSSSSCNIPNIESAVEAWPFGWADGQKENNHYVETWR
jgi:hypothetical protein